MKHLKKYEKEYYVLWKVISRWNKKSYHDWKSQRNTIAVFESVD